MFGDCSGPFFNDIWPRTKDLQHVGFRCFGAFDPCHNAEVKLVIRWAFDVQRGFRLGTSVHYTASFELRARMLVANSRETTLPSESLNLWYLFISDLLVYISYPRHFTCFQVPHWLIRSEPLRDPKSFEIGHRLRKDSLPISLLNGWPLIAVKIFQFLLQGILPHNLDTIQKNRPLVSKLEFKLSLILTRDSDRAVCFVSVRRLLYFLENSIWDRII